MVVPDHLTAARDRDHLFMDGLERIAGEGLEEAVEGLEEAFEGLEESVEGLVGVRVRVGGRPANS